MKKSKKIVWKLAAGLLGAALGLVSCMNAVPPAVETAGIPTQPIQTPQQAQTLPIPLTTSLPAVTPGGLPQEGGGTSVDLATPQTGPVFSIAGVEMHSISDAGGLVQTRAMGATWTRRNALLWETVEPQEGERRWEALAGLEIEMVNAYNSGLELILIVRATPAWAQMYPGVSCGPILPEKLAAFGQFMHDLVARYSGPPFNVRYWEIWNEPDIAPSYVSPDSLFGCWGDEADPNYGGAYYAQMLAAVYPQVKAANPDAQVLVGGLAMDCDPRNPPETATGSGELRSCISSRFLEGILQVGGAASFDGVSFHAYDYYQMALGAYGNPNWHSVWNVDGPSQIIKARFLSSLLNSYGAADKYLINTESAVICGRDGSEPECLMEDFQTTKAFFAAQVIASGLAEGLRAEVWYSVTGWRGSGLLNDDLTPRLVAQAIQTSSARLRNVVFVGELSHLAGVKGYEFSREGKRVWFLWSLDGQSHPVALEQMPSAVVDVFGNLMANTQSLDITLSPVYIEW